MIDKLFFNFIKQSNRLSNMKMVLFYAPTGRNTKSFEVGGAESGCIKTRELLRYGNYDVLTIEKPRKSLTGFCGSVLLIFKLVITWLRLIILFSKNKGKIFHIAGFYLNQIITEYLFISTARFFNIVTVYEIRNGGFVKSFQNGNVIYKKLVRSTLKKANLIYCQGYEYVPFITNAFNLESKYYPNYVLDEFSNYININSGIENEIQIVFVGRVVPSKNIELILKIGFELIKRKQNFKLIIIGGYEKEYFNSICTISEEFGILEKIEFLGRLDTKSIFNILVKSHFFVFPSKESREGHSNALTEAMSCGVVPIASNVGFNSSVIDCLELIIDDYNSVEYANRIINIYKSGNWSLYSKRMKERVMQNYTQKVVKESFLYSYSQL